MICLQEKFSKKSRSWKGDVPEKMPIHMGSLSCKLSTREAIFDSGRSRQSGSKASNAASTCSRFWSFTFQYKRLPYKLFNMVLSIQFFGASYIFNTEPPKRLFAIYNSTPQKLQVSGHAHTYVRSCPARLYIDVEHNGKSVTIRES